MPSALLLLLLLLLLFFLLLLSLLLVLFSSSNTSFIAFCTNASIFSSLRVDPTNCLSMISKSFLDTIPSASTSYTRNMNEILDFSLAFFESRESKRQNSLKLTFTNSWTILGAKGLIANSGMFNSSSSLMYLCVFYRVVGTFCITSESQRT